jgi:hypothetical protein
LKRVLQTLCFSPPRCAGVVEGHTHPSLADSRIRCAVQAQVAAKRSSD